ncbi:MAG: DUF1150 family protein [Rhizobiaceae bacterium]
MNTEETIGVMSEDQFAHLGEGHVAYVRKIQSDELIGRYPGLPELAPGMELWALFAADGQPILLTGERQAALAGAAENSLVPVSLH